MQIRKNVLIISILLTVLGLYNCTNEDPINSGTKTEGVLTVKATTATYNGEYAPRNVVAIWVETESGTFVKTLMVRAAQYKQYLSNWMKASSNGNSIDAVTGATAMGHSSHNVTWNGKNSSGATVGDGAYKVCIEFSESNSLGKYATFKFTKGAVADNQSPAATQNMSNVSINWAPATK